MSSKPHFTTRRGFITAAGFGGVSLYALWAGYGAAPGPLALVGAGAHQDDAAAATHDAHGSPGGQAEGAALAQFRERTSDFIGRYSLPDGSVYPRPLPVAASPDHGHDPHAGGHAAPVQPPHDDHRESPLDVYVLAEKWSYAPAHLRIDAGRPYRFRMMAGDVAHGASIQFGRGARMIRLRPGTVAEQELTFQRPGSYLIYCTVYCGQAHDLMQARITVLEPGKAPA